MIINAFITTSALNHKQNGKNSQKISKSKNFTDTYNWDGLNIP